MDTKTGEKIIAEFPPEKLARWEKIYLGPGVTFKLLREQLEGLEKKVEKCEKVVRTCCLVMVSLTIMLMVTITVPIIINYSYGPLDPLIFNSSIGWPMAYLFLGSVSVAFFALFASAKVQSAVCEIKEERNRYEICVVMFTGYIQPLLPKEGTPRLEIKTTLDMLTRLVELSELSIKAHDSVVKARADMHYTDEHLMDMIKVSQRRAGELEELYVINWELDYGVPNIRVPQDIARKSMTEKGEV